MNKSEELLHWGFHSHFCRYRTGTVIILKKALMILLAVCLLTSLLTGVLAEGHLEGKPWVNPEWPENVPDERPALENDFYLFVNYDLHRQPPMKTDSGSGDSIGTRIEKELADGIWRLVDAGESTEAKCLRILSSLIMDTDRREKEVTIDYLGFEIPDEFVVGYGLDYAQKYRNLPYIGVVHTDDEEEE